MREKLYIVDASFSGEEEFTDEDTEGFAEAFSEFDLDAAVMGEEDQISVRFNINAEDSTAAFQDAIVFLYEATEAAQITIGELSVSVEPDKE